MITARRTLALQALEKSLEVRESFDHDLRTPICVYELCERVGVSVRFLNDVSMEGFYARFARPAIVLSSLRPLLRRAYTCAHELGHHFFGHGSTLDRLEEERETDRFQPDEFLAQSFAGYLLMPALGVKGAFARRGVRPETASPTQVYSVACAFGVGYETLVTHMAYGLKLLPPQSSELLLSRGLPAVRRDLIGCAHQGPLTVLDQAYEREVVDTEVGSHLLMPRSVRAESDGVVLEKSVGAGQLYRATRPGLVRVTDGDWAVIVRISRARYSGLAKFRHLEEAAGE